MSVDPIRLLEEGNVSDAERALLEAAQTGAAIEYDVVAGAARFRASLALLAATSAAGVATAVAKSPGVAGGKALMAKLAFKVLVGLAAGTTMVGAGIVMGMKLGEGARPADAASLPLAAASPIAPRAAGLSASPVPEEGSLPAAPEEPTPLAPPPDREPARVPTTTAARAASALAVKVRGARRSVVREAASAGSAESTENVANARSVASVTQAQPEAPPHVEPVEPPHAEPSDSLGELRSIAVARDAVERNPEAALGVLDRIRREYPAGYFVEERQALTVIALARAGQIPLARQQAATFLRAYPNGPFADRIRAIRGM